MREICLDTETTGLDCRTERVIEIGCVELIDLIPSGKLFNVHINPQRALSAKITEITGLTDQDLEDKPVFADSSVCDAFLDFIGDSPMIAHNASFDRGFLNAELKRRSVPPLPADRFIDTLTMARAKFPGTGNSLDALAIRFGLSRKNRSVHGAYTDALLLAGVYLELRGGRARNFDFAPDKEPERAPPRENAITREPDANSRSRLTDAEAAAHDELIASLGESALWPHNRSTGG